MYTKAGPPERLTTVEAPDPQPGPGEVVVSVSFASITFADTQMRSGLIEQPDASPAGSPTSGIVPGNGVSGSVIAVGEDVDPAWIGRPVAAATGGGGYAERVAVPVGELYRLPRGLPLDSAAALIADGRTALALARAAGVAAGETVLVSAAAGGVGTLLVQLLRRVHGVTVIGLARGARKATVVDRLGGSGVNYGASGWLEALRHSAPGGVDVAFDGVGGATGSAILGLVNDGGRYVNHGMASGTPTPVDENDLQLRGVSVIRLGEIVRGPEDNRNLVNAAFREAAAGWLQPVIGQRYRLSEASDAHRAIEARETIGKTLLAV